MKSLLVLFLLLRALASSTLAAPTCTQTLVNADTDTSGGLSLSEYRSFLEQEAAKNGLVVDAMTSNDRDSPIGRLFTTLADGGAPLAAGEIDITGALTTDPSLVPMRQQAILELICVKSKALIHQVPSNDPVERKLIDSIPNIPFLGHNKQHQETHLETRQFKDPPFFGMELDFFGNNPIMFPECFSSVERLIQCTNLNCTDFLQSCKDPRASPEANFSLAIGNSIPKTCSEFGAAVRDAMTNLPESCCLSECFVEVYDLAYKTVQAAVPDKMIKSQCFPYADCYVDVAVAISKEYLDLFNVTTLVDTMWDTYFDFFGTIMSGEVITSECMESADNTVACMEKDCPNFWGSCVREFFSFPWSYGPEADSIFVNPQSFPLPTPAYFMVNSQVVDLTPANFGCANMTDAFCGLFNFPGTCCLSKCMDQVYDLAACMVDYAIGNNSDIADSCPTPLCAKTMAPSSAWPGKSILFLLCMCFGVVCLVLSGI